MQQDYYPSRIKSESSFFPRLEPTVFSSIENPEGPLTSEQLSSYDENGFLVLENFFTEQEVGALKNEAKQNLLKAKEEQSPELFFEGSSDVPRILCNLHILSETFHKVVRDSRLLRIIEQILGGSVYIHRTRISAQTAFSGTGFNWHSDFEYWHAQEGIPRMRILSLMIAFTSNYIFNGPLMLVPGSHKEFISCPKGEDEILKTYSTNDFVMPDQASIKKMVEKHGIYTASCNAGSILIFDSNILHGSNSNISPMERMNYYIVYNSVENKPVP